MPNAVHDYLVSPGEIGQIVMRENVFPERLFMCGHRPCNADYVYVRIARVSVGTRPVEQLGEVEKNKIKNIATNGGEPNILAKTRLRFRRIYTDKLWGAGNCYMARS